MSHVHHSHPERRAYHWRSSRMPSWSPQSTFNSGCWCSRALCISILRFVIWSLVPFLVGIPPVRLQFLFRSSLGSPKKHFGAWICILKPNTRNIKICILRKLLNRFQSNFAQWLRSPNTLRGWSKREKRIQDGGRPPSWKIEKSPYIGNSTLDSGRTRFGYKFDMHHLKIWSAYR